MLVLATLFSSYCLIHPSSSPTSHYLNIQVFLYSPNLHGFQDLRNNRNLHDYNYLYDLLVLRCPHHHLQSLKSFKTFKITFMIFEMRLTNWHLLSYPLFPTWLFSFLHFVFFLATCYLTACQSLCPLSLFCLILSPQTFAQHTSFSSISYWREKDICSSKILFFDGGLKTKVKSIS